MAGAGLRPSLLITLLILLSALIPLALSSKRLHKGPGRKGGEKVLRGRTLTDENGQSDGGTSYDSIVVRSEHSSDAVPEDGRRVVDFAYHLKTDILLWHELRNDGIRMTSCRLSRQSRFARFKLSGQALDFSDISHGVVFVLEREDWERCSMRPLRKILGIDPHDHTLFLAIRSVKFGRNSASVVAKVTPGRNVVPLIDIAVHDLSAAAEHVPPFGSDVEYEDEAPVPWTSHYAMDPSDGGSNYGNVTLPEQSRIGVSYKKKIEIADNAHIELSAGVNVKIRRFKLKRLSRAEFTWENELKASVQASLVLQGFMSSTKRTGSLVRYQIPSFSFKFSIPIVGKLKAGAFIGLNWFSQIFVRQRASVSFTAKYTRTEKVTARVIPPKFKVSGAKNSASGKPSFSIGPSAKTSLSMRGFYGVRPVVGVGLSYTYRKLKWKKWRPKFVKKKKSIEGNLGANFGLDMSLGYRAPPYPPYSKGGVKIGPCNTCHAVQGYANLAGKDLGIQAVKNGKVKDEKVLISKLFEVRLGTLCGLARPCYATRNVVDETRVSEHQLLSAQI